MGFMFNNYTTSDFFYYVAWLLLAPAIVCATAQLWMNKGKPLPTQTEEETLESIREKRSQKLMGLRNLAHKIKGKDY